RPLQFEGELCSWGIASCASEEPIITDDWLSRTLTWDWFERAEKAGVDWGALISEELCPWFAGCWQAVGGPARFSPAYLFFHDNHNEQHDLEQLRWIPAAQVCGEKPTSGTSRCSRPGPPGRLFPVHGLGGGSGRLNLSVRAKEKAAISWRHDRGL